MASGPLTTTSRTTDGAEEPPGLFGAVLHAVGSPEPVRLGPAGPTLLTTLHDSRDALTRAEEFVLPFDVSRRRLRRGATSQKETRPLSAEAVATGRRILADELAAADPAFTGPDVDTKVFLRTPVARSTTASLVPEADPAAAARIGDLALAWIDSLAPIISASRPPRRWSSVRRAEHRANRRLVAELTAVRCESPAARATALAAGIQVPIAAGAWCLTQLACRPDLQRRLRQEPALAPAVVWETLRLFPPSWLLPRVTTRDVELGHTSLPAYTPVVVSPLALGRLPEVVPGAEAGFAEINEFDPDRWVSGGTRPGGWLPFGAGAHACPGRNLGLALLQDLVSWAAGFALHSAGPPTVDASRGLSPDPSGIGVDRAQ